MKTIIRYKQKILKVERLNGNYLFELSVKNNVKYSKKLTKKQIEKMVEALEKEKTMKVDGIELIMLGKFVNFRISKKAVSMFFPRKYVLRGVHVGGIA